MLMITHLNDRHRNFVAVFGCVLLVFVSWHSLKAQNQTSQSALFKWTPSRNWSKADAQIERVHLLLQERERSIPSVLPVRGRISSRFGHRKHPHTQDLKLHTGIDIVALPGSPVAATADGWVVFSGDREGYGKVVVIDHGFGMQTVYAHNSSLKAILGAKVSRGELIARVGSTGHTTGPHLHYEVRQNGLPIDPKPFLKAKRSPSF